MQASLIAFMISLVLSALLFPWLIIWMRSHDEGQQIRDEGPKWHEKKSGTPTMGGTVFVLSAAVATVAICAYKGQLSKTVWILLVALLGYGIIGFLDDGLKLFFKRNLGLRAWQKMDLQLLVAAGIVLLAASDNFDFALYLPFAGVVKNVVLFTLFEVFWLVGF